MKKRTVAVVMAAAMTIGMMVTGVSVQAGVEDKTLIVGFDAEYPPFVHCVGYRILSSSRALGRCSTDRSITFKLCDLLFQYP